MTNSEKIKAILKPRTDQIKIYGDWVEIEIQSLAINFSCSLEWWNAEYKEPTTKNDLGVESIDRAELLKAMNTWDKFGYDPNERLIPLRAPALQDRYVPYVKYDDMVNCVKGMPSVTPQLSSELDKNSKKLEKDFGESDFISRDSAIKALDYDIKCFKFKFGVHKYMDDIAKLLNTIYETQVNNIKALPSVAPQEPRKGHWISRWHAGHDLHFHVCSECNEEFSCDMETGISIDDYRYCPNCGADMREVEE